MANVKGLPPEPGTAPIPEGHVRLYHQTSPKHVESIRKNGILLSHARGIEGPKAIYADEAGFYGKPSEHTTVEFHVPKEQFRSPFVQSEAVKPESIVGIHEPWHSTTRYLHKNGLTETLRGDYDHMLDDHQHNKAITHLKTHYGAQPLKDLKERLDKALRLTAHQPRPVQSGAVKAADQDWHREGTYENPFNHRSHVVQAGEAVGKYEIVPHTSEKNHAFLSNVHAVTRGGGRAVLEHLTRQADKHGVSISLHPVPLAPAGEGKKMTTAKLKTWYHGFGFRPTKDDRMTRTPSLLEKSMADETPKPSADHDHEYVSKPYASKGTCRHCGDVKTFFTPKLKPKHVLHEQLPKGEDKMKKSSPALWHLYQTLEKSYFMDRKVRFGSANNPRGDAGRDNRSLRNVKAGTVNDGTTNTTVLRDGSARNITVSPVKASRVPEAKKKSVRKDVTSAIPSDFTTNRRGDAMVDPSAGDFTAAMTSKTYKKKGVLKDRDTAKFTMQRDGSVSRIRLFAKAFAEFLAKGHYNLTTDQQGQVDWFSDSKGEGFPATHPNYIAAKDIHEAKAGKKKPAVKKTKEFATSKP